MSDASKTHVQLSSAVYCNLLRSCVARGHSTFGVLTGWRDIVAVKQRATDEAEVHQPSASSLDEDGGDAANADAADGSNNRQARRQMRKAKKQQAMARLASPHHCTYVVCQFHLLKDSDNGRTTTPASSSVWQREMQRMGIRMRDVVGCFRFRGNTPAVPSAREISFHNALHEVVNTRRERRKKNKKKKQKTQTGSDGSDGGCDGASSDGQRVQLATPQLPLVFVLVNFDDSDPILRLTTSVFRIVGGGIGKGAGVVPASSSPSASSSSSSSASSSSSSSSPELLPLAARAPSEVRMVCSSALLARSLAHSLALSLTHSLHKRARACTGPSMPSRGGRQLPDHSRRDFRQLLSPLLRALSLRLPRVTGGRVRRPQLWLEQQ